jgi:hypothetical protein
MRRPERLRPRALGALGALGLLLGACAGAPQSTGSANGGTGGTGDLGGSSGGAGHAAGGAPAGDAGTFGADGAALGGSPGSAATAGISGGGGTPAGSAGTFGAGGDGVAGTHGDSGSGGSVGGSAAAGRGGAGGSVGAGGVGGGGGAGKGGGDGNPCGLPATVSFQKDVQPFLTTTCGGGSCHVIDASSTASMGGYDHAYDWITATAHPSSCPSTPTPKRFQVVIAVIDAADPASCSKSRIMPPQNVTGADLRKPLTTCQIATLQAWLAEPLVTQMHRVDDTDPAGTAPFPMPPFN